MQGFQKGGTWWRVKPRMQKIRLADSQCSMRSCLSWWQPLNRDQRRTELGHVVDPCGDAVILVGFCEALRQMDKVIIAELGVEGGGLGIPR